MSDQAVWVVTAEQQDETGDLLRWIEGVYRTEGRARAIVQMLEKEASSVHYEIASAEVQ